MVELLKMRIPELKFQHQEVHSRKFLSLKKIYRCWPSQIMPLLSNLAFISNLKKTKHYGFYVLNKSILQQALRSLDFRRKSSVIKVIV